MQRITYLQLCIVLLTYFLPRIFQAPAFPSPTLDSIAPLMLLRSTGGILVLLLLQSGSARKRGWGHFGVRRPRPTALLQGLLLLTAMLALRLALNIVSMPTPRYTASLLLVAALLSAACFEELLFRSYVFATLKELQCPVWLAALLSTALFALAHLYQGTEGLVHAFLQGLLLVIAFQRWKNIAPLAFAHGSYNLAVLANIV